MAKENKEIETDNKAVDIDFSTNIKEKFDEAFSAVQDAVEEVSDLKTKFNDLIPDKFEACEIPKYISNVTELGNTIIKIPIETASKVTSALSGINADIDVNVDTSGINVPQKALNYPQISIILKYFEILKKNVEVFKLIIQKAILEATNKMLRNAANAEGDAASPILATISGIITAVGTTLTIVIQIIDIIMAMISSIVMLSIDGAGCAFFMTPKTMQATKMKILNANFSITNSIPEPINLAISKAEETINQTNMAKKIAAISESASAGAAAAASSAGFTLPQFPSLDKFNPDIIRAAIALLLIPLQFTADALPRYEKLNPFINLRFMIFLLTGFELAARQSFGMPGYP